jgi:hypothetical protein
MRKIIAATGICAGLGLGGFAIGSVLPVGATGEPPSASTSTSTPRADSSTDLSRPAGTILKDALDGLVAKGTITQDQADAVVAAVGAEAADHPLVGHPFLRVHIVEEAFGLAAKTIGISTEELRSAVQSGKSIADVANDHSVDPQKVIDALVKAASDRLDVAVQAGRLSADTAATIKSHLPDAIGRFVNTVHTAHGSARPGG